MECLTVLCSARFYSLSVPYIDNLGVNVHGNVTHYKTVMPMKRFYTAEHPRSQRHVIKYSLLLILYSLSSINLFLY